MIVERPKTAAEYITLYGLHPIFAECVGSASRYDFSHPFALANWAFSTNGKILVRTKKPTMMPETVGGSVPNPNLLPAWPSRKPADAIELPAVIYEPNVCNSCKGLGKVSNGESPPGRIACEDCDGDGQIDHFTGVPIGTAGIATIYIDLLRRHGVTAVYQVETKKSRECFYFKSDAFDGLVMACKLGASR